MTPTDATHPHPLHTHARACICIISSTVTVGRNLQILGVIPVTQCICHRVVPGVPNARGSTSFVNSSYAFLLCNYGNWGSLKAVHRHGYSVNKPLSLVVYEGPADCPKNEQFVLKATVKF